LAMAVVPVKRWAGAGESGGGDWHARPGEAGDGWLVHLGEAGGGGWGESRPKRWCEKLSGASRVGVGKKFYFGRPLRFSTAHFKTIKN
jgi:hypothetical protein